MWFYSTSVGKPQELSFKLNVFYRHTDAPVVARQTTCYENPQYAQFSNNISTETLFSPPPNYPNWSLCNVDCSSYDLIIFKTLVFLQITDNLRKIYAQDR